LNQSTISRFACFVRLGACGNIPNSESGFAAPSNEILEKQCHCTRRKPFAQTCWTTFTLRQTCRSVAAAGCDRLSGGQQRGRAHPTRTTCAKWHTGCAVEHVRRLLVR
jgi:hypothetical protein